MRLSLWRRLLCWVGLHRRHVDRRYTSIYLILEVKQCAHCASETWWVTTQACGKYEVTAASGQSLLAYKPDISSSTDRFPA